MHISLLGEMKKIFATLLNQKKYVIKKQSLASELQ